VVLEALRLRTGGNYSFRIGARSPCVNNRVSHFQKFSILTQALSIIFVVLFVGQQAYTGGTNGITNFKTIFVRFPFCFAGGLCKRDSENRARFSGYNPAIYKTFVYCISAGLAGLAGALFVPQVGIISPAEMGIVPSVEMVIWVAIGGRGTLVGSVIGAILVNSLKSMVSESFPAVWSYFLYCCGHIYALRSGRVKEKYMLKKLKKV